MPVFRREAIRAFSVAAVAAVLTAGCASTSPSISVLGAYFPDWLFCIVAGVALTIVAYIVLERTQYSHRLGPSVVVYPTLTTLFALAVWLILFQH
ncbi:YtcA family lipoprotein [Pararobbsia alpina]|uniref:Uncharacterized protein YtcA n=1 Tax=Pararobbsia alpina TaxID=621374 RepID=A0A6S7CHI0_9BURK|nr:YtcA family lipoprotein [Pararobbsia alpina]CAB3790119.1 hypothetical protein LMG28138_02922 [Pararobbsia alpina]